MPASPRTPPVTRMTEPRTILDSSIEARFRAQAADNSSPIHRIVIEVGSIADYRALARFH